MIIMIMIKNINTNNCNSDDKKMVMIKVITTNDNNK